MEGQKDRETCAEVVKEEDEEEEEQEEEDDNGDFSDCENALMIKRRISTHPLYEKLVEIHLDCLKVGLAGEAGGDRDRRVRNQGLIDYNKSTQRMLHQSDLDRFMEAYCVALRKLREAMEEPQQESMAFISSMHSQLQQMTAIPLSHSNPSLPLPLPPPSPTSSGN